MTWPSIREQILQDLKARFESIDGTGQFQLKVGRVTRDNISPGQAGTDDFPLIIVTMPVEDLAHKDFQRITNQLRFFIRGYVKAQEGESPAELIEKLIHDVKVAFYENQGVRFSGLAVTSLLGPQIRPIEGTDEQQAGFDADAVVQYRHLRETA